MSTNRIILNETSYFGPGSREVLISEIKARNFRKVLLVTDKDLVKFGVAGKITALLEKGGIGYELFCDIKQNPTVRNVNDALAAFEKADADVIVALGGGSAIDTAKAVGIISANPDFRDVVSLEGVAPTTKKSTPVIALPTTAGTAAEVTINYVITDEENVKKMVCVDPKDIPVVAIVDAELMASMPKGLTAATGMDALTHAIEGYITKGAWTLTDMFELKAIELIAKYLPAAVENGGDMDARNGMAHPLGAYYDIPHGVANAMLLPVVMQYNMESSIGKYADIAAALGVDTEGMDEKQKAQAAVDAVKALAVRVGIPEKLSALGVKEEGIPALAKSALADVCTPGNPKETCIEDIEALYRKIL